MAGGSWRSDPLDAWLLHLDARLCNVLRMPQSEPSLKEGLSNCSELPAGNSAASLRLMKSIWKVFAMQGCRRTDSGVGAWGQTANVWTGAVGWGCGELSWLNPRKERARNRLHLQQGSKHYSTSPCYRLRKACILFTQETKWPMYKAAYRLNVWTRQIW